MAMSQCGAWMSAVNVSPRLLADLFNMFVGDPAVLLVTGQSFPLYPNLRGYLSTYMDIFRREVNLLMLVTA